MHITAIRFALRYHFRLCRSESRVYYLVDCRAQRVDTPAWGERTAAGAIRMMRRHLRLGLDEARAFDPLSRHRLHTHLAG